MTTTDREGGRRPRTRRRPLIWLGVLLALAAAGAFWFRWQCWGVQTTHTVAELSGLPAGFDGCRIAHLSDLHGHEYGEDSRELVVDDRTSLISLLRRDRRYGVLSQVLVRDRWSGRVEAVNNAAFQRAGGQARRVITMPTRSSYKTMRYSGQFQLNKSAAGLVQVELTVGQAFCAWPGDLVTVQRSGWGWNGRYRAVQVINGMDQDGLWSRVELAEPDVLI